MPGAADALDLRPDDEFKQIGPSDLGLGHTTRMSPSNSPLSVRNDSRSRIPPAATANRDNCAELPASTR